MAMTVSEDSDGDAVGTLASPGRRLARGCPATLRMSEEVDGVTTESECVSADAPLFRAAAHAGLAAVDDAAKTP